MTTIYIATIWESTHRKRTSTSRGICQVHQNHNYIWYMLYKRQSYILYFNIGVTSEHQSVGFKVPNRKKKHVSYHTYLEKSLWMLQHLWLSAFEVQQCLNRWRGDALSNPFTGVSGCIRLHEAQTSVPTHSTYWRWNANVFLLALYSVLKYGSGCYASMQISMSLDATPFPKKAVCDKNIYPGNFATAICFPRF